MPLRPFEKSILRLLAAHRNPESFVAGATVLLRDEKSHRRSQDIDVFHDTTECLTRSSAHDCKVLEEHGYKVTLDNVQETFRRAIVSNDAGTTKVEWVFDSAFRFFPVEADPELGYVLNFWDAATNKLLAMAGRGELRDYLDVLYLNRKHLSLGALAWAAAGKDLGYTPQFLLEEAQRLTHYPKTALQKLDLTEPVDLVECKKQFKAAYGAAFLLFNQLPAEEVGCLYLNEQSLPVTPDPASPDFPKLRRHFGSVRGAWPRIRE
jgi:hypothetical protein